MLTYKSHPFRVTKKQMNVLTVIARGDDDGGFIDLDQLLERIDYETTKGSMHFTLRGLIRRGMVEKKGMELRRGRRRLVLAPTPKGMSLARDDSSGGGVVMEGFDEE
jgi:DNA-binding MarR family transcriptional regulator